MLPLAVAFVLGNLCGLLCPAILPDTWCQAALAAAAVAVPWRQMRCVGFALAGFGLALLALASHREGLQVEEERVLVEAAVASLPQVTGAAVHFDAWVRMPREPSRGSRYVRIAWSGAAGRGLRAGERWQLLLRLRSPQGACNPGAVDTARNALRDHIQAFGSVIASPLDRRLSSASPSLLGLRERIAARIESRVADPASAALLAALAVGATGDVSREQWRVFNATGITHLVAISGSHVTAFALVAMKLVRWLWGFAARWGYCGRRERIVAVAGVVLASGYALLAGAGVPTQRTLLMLAAFLLLRECGRVVRPGTPLGLAAVAVILADPFSTLSAGFWLSFLAVAAILGHAGNRVLRESGLRAAVSVQGAVFVALLPVSFAIFGSVSLAGLLVNGLAIPLFGLVLVPLVLAATAAWLVLPDAIATPLAGVLLDLAAAAARPAMTGLQAAADLPGALWFVAPPLWWYGLAALAIVIVLAPGALRLRVGACCVLLPLVSAADRPDSGELRMTHFDVGAATAVLLETGQHRVLYGLGESFRSGGSQTERVTLPALSRLGAVSLDALVLPVLDRDAGAGVTALVARLPVNGLFAPGADHVLPPDFTGCEGFVRDWDGWHLESLALPGAGCVLRASGPGGRVLLADGVDASGEAAILSRWPEPLQVLLVPRHASASASTLPFLSALRARFAVAGLRAGDRDRSGLQDVKTRHALAGSQWLDTATRGAIRLRLNAAGDIQVAGCRDDRIGSWMASPLPRKSAAP